MRMIDADEVRLQKGFFEKVNNVPKFYEWLDSLPTVDAAPVRHGRLLNPNPYGECSLCGYLIDIRDSHNYCPNCGAKMDGGIDWIGAADGDQTITYYADGIAYYTEGERKDGADDV